MMIFSPQNYETVKQESYRETKSIIAFCIQCFHTQKKFGSVDFNVGTIRTRRDVIERRGSRRGGGGEVKKKYTYLYTNYS